MKIVEEAYQIMIKLNLMDHSLSVKMFPQKRIIQQILL